jgi:cysteinyl-tRNA synthetase
MGRRLVDFVPREDGEVGIYVCGPTVQSEPHVGHGRYAVAFDVIRRYLTWRGYDVTYVSNITDIEDKIIAAAAETGETVEDLALRMAERFSTSFRRLGVLPPDVEPKATEHIPEMLDLIARLIERGLAYERDGDVWFSVKTLEGYGRLSGRKPDELRSGYRIEVDESKEDPLDFALWKSAKPGEPTWESPWGPGRPGWHIECSAMAARYLGDGFDIHGGGLDLIFPHHENEVAQSEGASGETFARYWLHNGMVNLGGEKMSKSTGQIVDLEDILDTHGGRALRMLYARAHYRSPIEYSEELIAEAEESLERLDRFRERVEPGEADPEALERFTEVMDDDFGTPQAVSVMFDLIREGNRILDDGGDASAIAGAVEAIVDVLGLDDAEPAPVATADVSDEEIETLVNRRQRARADRDFAEADRIRDELAAAGVSIEDGPHGSRWVRK